jgi:hypothetical protein
MHPPYNLTRDRELKETLGSLRADAFLMDKVNNHNPALATIRLKASSKKIVFRLLSKLSMKIQSGS